MSPSAAFARRDAGSTPRSPQVRCRRSTRCAFIAPPRQARGSQTVVLLTSRTGSPWPSPDSRAKWLDEQPTILIAKAAARAYDERFGTRHAYVRAKVNGGCRHLREIPESPCCIDRARSGSPCDLRLRQTRVARWGCSKQAREQRSGERGLRCRQPARVLARRFGAGRPAAIASE